MKTARPMVPIRRPLAPSVTEVVADDLRRRIVTGEFDDSGLLPRAVRSMNLYGISRPTLREVYRVLETERLISRDPDNHWNLRVHPPSVTVAGRAARLLLGLEGAGDDEITTTADLLRTRVGDDNRAATVLAEVLLCARSSGDADRAPESAGSEVTALAADLWAAMESGRLPPGARLPTEARMREDYGVSRIQVREALRILEAEGLVVVERGARGGAIVSHPGPGPTARYVGYLLQYRGVTLEEFFALRRAVEVETAVLAAAGRVDTSLLHARIARDGTRTGDVVGATEEAIRFHETLARSSGSAVLAVTFALFESVLQMSAVERFESELDRATADEILDHAHHDHRALIDHIEAGDVDRARELWRNHCQPRHRPGDDRVIDVFVRSARL
ncbi:GntR family transcriptional regulator [Gordonia terrae]